MVEGADRDERTLDFRCLKRFRTAFLDRFLLLDNSSSPCCLVDHRSQLQPLRTA